MFAKKHLGQHFLTSQKALFDMVTAGEVATGDLILEIGPGKGVLTKELLKKGATVVAIEKDAELIPHLQAVFEAELSSGQLTILPQDILLFNPDILKDYKQPYKVIANIPYYITGAIIEQFLGAQHQPECMVLLIQKEVAERIIARDQRSGNLGGKQSILSIAVSAYGVPNIISKVPAGAFFPPPKVDSAILSIKHISREFFKTIDEQHFFSIVKACFSKKRKQLVKSIGEYLEDRIKAQQLLQKAEISETARPETLSKEDWKRIVSFL